MVDPTDKSLTPNPAADDSGGVPDHTIKSLRESEARYRALVEASAQVVWATDACGETIGDSTGWQALTGQSLEESKGLGWLDAVHPEDRDRTLRLWRGAVEQVVPYRNEYRLRLAGGGYGWFFVRAVPVLDEGGVREWVGACTDISTRKEAEERLRQSDERFRTSVENMLDCFGIYTAVRDESGRITDFRIDYVNAAACADNLLPREEQVGRNLCKLFPRHRASGLFDEYRRVVETGEPLEKEAFVYEDEFGGRRLSRAFDIRAVKLGDGFTASWRDVTERVRAEAALRESESRFRQLAENVKDVFWITEMPGRRVAYVSSAFERLWGMSRERLYQDQLNWVDAIHPEDRERVERAFTEMAAEGDFNEEYRVVNPAGSVRWIRDRGFPVRDDRGTLVRVTGIAEDITERKSSEALLRQFLDNAPLPLGVVELLEDDSDIFHFYDNPATCRFFGMPDGATVGKLARAELNVRPETVRLWAHHYRESERTGAPVKFEYGYERRGEPRWLEVVVWPLGRGASGRSRFSYAGEDVTEARRQRALAEEGKRTLDALMEYIPEGVVVADAPDVRIRLVSAYGEIIAGRPRETLSDIAVGELVGRYGIYHLDGVTPAKEEELALTRATLKGEVIRDEEWVMRRPDGTSLIVQCNAGPIRDAEGRVTGGVITWRDISDRKRAEAEREELYARERAARSEAQEANRIKDEFLATLSHELRTPLTSILGWSRLLEEGRMDSTAATRAVEIIRRNAEAQNHLIRDLLDLSRIISGKLALETLAVDLASVVEAAADTVRPAAEAKGVILRTLLEPAAGPVSGDAGRLQQVVWNLLSNAVKFTPQGGSVEARLMRRGARVEVVVSDTGQGISPDFLPYVFDRFRQAEGPGARSKGGLGLGLSIVRQLVELHGGTVRAESGGEGNGATFTVSLPLMTGAAVSAPEGGTVGESVAPPQLKGVRVLVVEDEADTAELVCRLLSACGAEVSSVASAAEALREVEGHRPDVLVSDIGMPGGDGYELIRLVRDWEAKYGGGRIPAVALTAYARVEDRVRALQAGYQLHVPKPVEAVELATAVASLIKDRKS